MGGKGSGRPPSTETIIKRMSPEQTPIGDGIFLPNYSGLQAVKKTDTPLSQSYYISGSVVVDSDKVDGEHASAFEDANANIQTHVIGTGSPHTWAGIDKTISSIADITTKSHTALSDIGTNSHAAVDTHIAATGTAVHGLGGLAVQNGANVTISGGAITGITDLAVADGGTGKSSWIIGGIVYASGTGALANAGTFVLSGGNVVHAGNIPYYRLEDTGWQIWDLKSSRGDFVILRGETVEVLRMIEGGAFKLQVAGKPIITKTIATDTNPAGLADYAGIFAKDVSSSAELFAIDEAGNVSPLSPHNSEGKLIIASENIYSGEKTTIDIEALAEAVQELTGRQIIKKEIMADEKIQEWDREEEPPGWLIPKKRK